MTDRHVEAVLNYRPFAQLAEEGYRKSLSLRGIIQNDSRIVAFDRGDVIVRAGDWGNSAFFILSGSVHVEIGRSETRLEDRLPTEKSAHRRTLFQSIAQLWTNRAGAECRDCLSGSDAISGTKQRSRESRIYLPDVSAVLDEHETARIGPGEWFGELSALGRTARSATVFASEQTEVLEIRWQGLRDLMRFDTEGLLTDTIESAFRERALSTFLRNDVNFRDLSDDQVRELATAAEFKMFGEYDSPDPFKELAQAGAKNGFKGEAIIFEEGHYPNEMLIVRSGLARLSVKKHHGLQTVSYLSAGQSFGFEEIREGYGKPQAVPYAHSLRAISYLSAIVIPAPAIERILWDNKPATTQTISTTNDRHHPVEDDVLEFLVGQKYVQATAAMVIDLNRCVRCDDCVHACATAHDNNPRFIRHGPVHGDHMLANACLHCADPLCLVECPTGAIHRESNSGLVVINEATCIGCSSCAMNCKYDAIRMVPVRDSQGTLLVDETSNQPLLQATKCDLCIDQVGGPACQNACGHDALVRVDLRTPEQMQRVFAND